MSKMILAAFPNRTDADDAVNELEEMGYEPADISIISQESTKAADGTAADDALEGAASGAATGGAIGGVAGLLAGAGVLPALAGLLIGGPIAAALGATGVVATTISGAVTGAVAGGLIGALTNLGVSQETAEYYDRTVREGGVVIAVPVREASGRDARAILSDQGAQEIQEVALEK